MKLDVIGSVGFDTSGKLIGSSMIQGSCMFLLKLTLQGLTSSAVLQVKIDGSGMPSVHAFILFFNEKLANTAMLFDGLEICGRRLRLRRPHEYCPPDGCSAVTAASVAFDVSILYRLGMLTEVSEPTGGVQAARPKSVCPAGATSKSAAKPPKAFSLQQGLRHVYIGNLPERHRSLQDITELVTCMCSELVSYKKDLGSAMIAASPVRDGWVVELQSSELALDLQNCLRKMVLDGVQLSAYLTFGSELANF